MSNPLGRFMYRHLEILNDLVLMPFLSYTVQGDPLPFWSSLPKFAQLISAGRKPKIYRFFMFLVEQMEYLGDEFPWLLLLACMRCTRLTEHWVELRNSVVSKSCSQHHVTTFPELRRQSVMTGMEGHQRKRESCVLERKPKASAIAPPTAQDSDDDSVDDTAMSISSEEGAKADEDYPAFDHARAEEQGAAFGVNYQEELRIEARKHIKYIALA